MQRGSLGRRVTRTIVLALGGFFLLGGFVLHAAVKELLVSQFDHALLTKARTLTRFPTAERTGINLTFTEAPLPEFQWGADAEYYQVWLQNGTVLAKSPSLGSDQELPRRTDSEALDQFLWLTLPDGRHGRAVALRLSSQQGGGPEDFRIDLTLARSSEDLSQILRRLVLGFLGGGVGLLVLAWIVVRVAARAALRPVDVLAARVGDIDADSLTSRINSESLSVDLQPIAEQINDLVERLEAAFSRERRFASNAAHELLTPLAELRVAADNALDWPDDPRATVKLAKDACELSGEMEHVVRSLLALSRAEAHLTPLNSDRFDLGVMIKELLDFLKPEMSEQGLQVQCDLPRGCILITDQVLVRSILNNLILNAIEYSTARSDIGILGRIEGEAVEVRVTNRPERAIRAEDLERFCEAFWRSDKVRSTRDHAGLGLALSRAFALLLGGDLRFEFGEGNAVIACLRIPSRSQTSS